MSSKSVNVDKNVHKKLIQCKKEPTERLTDVVDRLLDKHEKELLNNG